MNIKFFILLSISVFAGITGYTQELTSKIPAQAQFVLTINNKAIVKNSSIELLNETLLKLGAFDNEPHAMGFSIKDLTELGFNLDKQSYIYRTDTDSLYYIGILIPLNAKHQVKERMFSKFNILASHNGFERRISQDEKKQVAWNEEMLFILTGSPKDSYFDIEEIANRYGLNLESYGEHDSYDTFWTADEALAEEIYIAESETIDTISWETEVEESVAEESAIEEVIDATQEWDSYLESSDLDSYDLTTDSIYLLNKEREANNDSIKNNTFVNWLANDFATYLAPQNNLANTKAIKIIDQKILLRMWVADLDKLYKDAYSYDILKTLYGVNTQDIKYGYKDASMDVIVDNNNLKIAGSLQVDKDLTQIFKALHKNKINKKFSQYIPEFHLAYSSMNVSTEGYLKHLPTLIARSYAPLAGEYGDMIQIAMTALEIGLDEKSIAKVMKGDYVFFLNDLQKVSKEYVTYDYDDDYNSIEVVKTKDEYSPNFLLMFTSEDQRIFKKTLEFAVKKQKVMLEEEIYTIAPTKDTESIYVIFKKDIVFIGNNLEQITAIQENRFKTSRQAKVKKDILTYPFNFVVNTSAIPEVIDQLEIPITADWNPTLQNLSTFGDFQIRFNKFNKNRLSGEMSLDLPKKENNALQYILKQVIQNIDSKITN